MKRLAVLFTVAVAGLAVVSAPAAAAPACTKTWDSGAGTSSWHDASNWSPDGVPGAGDHVCIPASAGVTFSTGTTSVQTVQVAGALLISGGTLSLTSTTDESSVSGSATFTGGVLGGAGTLAVTGDFTWMQGTWSGSGETRIDPAGVFLIDGGFSPMAPVLSGSRVLRNSGGEIEHRGELVVGGTATLRNDSGLFEGKDSSTGELSRISCDVSCADPVFLNAGTLQSSGSYLVSVGFENTGTVEATAAGGFLTLESATTTRFKVGSHVAAGAGTVFLGGTVAVDGATTIDAGALADMFGLTTLDGAGTLTVAGELRHKTGTQAGSGETNIVAGGTLVIEQQVPDPLPDPIEDADGPRLGGSRILRNSGGTIQQAGHLRVGGTATIHNDSGTYVGEDSPIPDLSRITCDISCADPVFINAATLQSSGSFFVNVGLENTGTVKAVANGGFLTLESDTTTIRFKTGSHIAAGAGTVFLGQAVAIDGTTAIDPGATVDTNPGVSIAGAGDLSVAGKLIFDGGTHGGSGETRVLAGGSLIIDREVSDPGPPPVVAAPPVFAGSRTLRNTGGTIELHREMRIGGTATVRNDSGTFLGEPSVGNDVAIQCAAGGCPDPALINNGTLDSDAPGTFTVDVGFDNPGTVRVDEGTLKLLKSFAQFTAATKTLTAGVYEVKGTFRFQGADIETNAAGVLLDGPSSAILDDVGASNALAGLDTNAAGARLAIRNDRDLATPAFTNAGAVVIGQDSAFSSSGAYTQTAGSTLLERATSTLTATGAVVHVQAGTLGGIGQVGPSVVNDGSVEPGLSPGVLTVNGDYTQTTGGALGVEIGGTAAGSGFDRLHVTGSCTVAGTLNIATIGGFTPNGSDVFRFLVCGARVGTFGTVTGTDLSDRRYRVVYDATGAELAVEPEVSVSDVTVTEGNAGTTNAGFAVTLTTAPGSTVTVDYATADGTATSPGDYTAKSGTIQFVAGDNTETIAVPVVGDTADEPDETFTVTLSNATGATIDDGHATGTITDDDEPPAPDKIVFSSSRSGLGDIYTMDANGSSPTRLTTNGAPDLEPAWSPDRSKIAFTSARTGNGDVYVMNANGTGQTRLTTSTSPDGSPAWSPDGMKIAFATGRTGGGDVYVMNANGSGQTRLTTSTAFDGFPDWAPSAQIAFDSTRTGNGDVYAMNPNGSAQTRLTTSSAFDGLPSWAPGGAKIAFTSGRTGNGDVYAMNASGSSQTRLTTSAAADGEPAWSNDGSTIVFSSTRTGFGDIYSMQDNGSAQTRLTNNPAVDLSPDR